MGDGGRIGAEESGESIANDREEIFLDRDFEGDLHLDLEEGLGGDLPERGERDSEQVRGGDLDLEDLRGEGIDPTREGVGEEEARELLRGEEDFEDLGGLFEFFEKVFVRARGERGIGEEDFFRGEDLGELEFDLEHLRGEGGRDSTGGTGERVGEEGSSGGLLKVKEKFAGRFDCRGRGGRGFLEGEVTGEDEPEGEVEAEEAGGEPQRLIVTWEGGEEEEEGEGEEETEIEGDCELAGDWEVGEERNNSLARGVKEIRGEAIFLNTRVSLLFLGFFEGILWRKDLLRRQKKKKKK